MTSQHGMATALGCVQFLNWVISRGATRPAMAHLQPLRLRCHAVGLNHGDEDGDVPQRAALSSRYAHPEGVSGTLGGSEGDGLSSNGITFGTRTLFIHIKPEVCFRETLSAAQ